MTDTDSIREAKQVLREDMTRERAALPLAKRKAGAGTIADTGIGFAAPSPRAAVSAYAAIGEELDPEPLLTKLAEAGHALALPVTPPRGQPLTFRQWRPGEVLEDAPFSLRQPGSGAREIRPDILLVPLLAFDARGYRLGYGAGYFDRTLAKLRSEREITAIGIAFDVQEVENVPHADYDQPLDWVLTPSGPRLCER